MSAPDLRAGPVSPKSGGSAGARQVVPRLHLITNRHLCGDRPQAAIVAEAVRGGLGAVQLREKDLGPAALLDEAELLLPVLGGTPLIVNGQVEVARAAGAAGVHLPGDAGPVAVARAALGAAALIGRSVHSLEEARSAEAEGADYVILGTIFATDSKPGRAPAGLPLVTAVARAVSIPVIAIGGIDEGNAAATLAAGAWGLAVMSGILRAAAPATAVARLRAIIEKETR
jgi:thiamine-phosphate pyrophosphorylase